MSEPEIPRTSYTVQVSKSDKVRVYLFHYCLLALGVLASGLFFPNRATIIANMKTEVEDLRNMLKKEDKKVRIVIEFDNDGNLIYIKQI